jgi:hypothetical protein
MLIKARRVGFVAAATAATTVMVASTAVAAPTRGLSFDVTCPAPLGEFVVTTPPGDPNGRFTPAFSANQVFIPYEITGTVTVDGVLVEEINDVKPAPVPADAITCTFETQFEEEGATVVIAGEVVVVQRGKP